MNQEILNAFVPYHLSINPVTSLSLLKVTLKGSIFVALELVINELKCRF